MFSLEKRKFQGELVEFCLFLKGHAGGLERDFFHRRIVTGQRGDGFKLKEGRIFCEDGETLKCVAHRSCGSVPG